MGNIERREAIQRALMRGKGGNVWITGWADDLAKRVDKALPDPPPTEGAVEVGSVPQQDGVPVPGEDREDDGVMGLIAHRIACPACGYSGSSHGHATFVRVGEHCHNCAAAKYVEFVPASQLEEAVSLLDELDRYVGHGNCGVVHGAPECDCGFDGLYTRVRAVVRGR